jgi:hypothetical protein
VKEFEYYKSTIAVGFRYDFFLRSCNLFQIRRYPDLTAQLRGPGHTAARFSR